MARSEIKPKARCRTSSATKIPIPKIRLLCRILIIFTLAASSTALTQLALSPVYGSIPSTRAKTWKVPCPWSAKFQIAVPWVWAMPLAMLARTYLSRRQQNRIQELLPLFGIFLPVTLSEALQFGGIIGPTWGPALTSLCATGPLLSLSLLSAVHDLHLMVSRELGMGSLWMWDLPLVVGCYAVMDKLQDLLGGVLALAIAMWSGVSPGFSRFGVLAVISLCYALLGGPRKILTFVGSIALLHLFLINPHLPLAHNTGLLNATLQSESYSLLARQESLTGYISVLDNVKDGFRVMRCDHSLLGGEWINKPPGHPAVLNEPIYSIFVMLEAVRLVETESSRTREAKVDQDKRALVIGLGVGTAPAALIAHGIDVTTVEIDTVVHDFATLYFDLQDNHTSIIGDAIVVIQDLETKKEKYDYIIHDVFTGGAEPIELFTQGFLRGLKSLLSPNGAIAINYAGDLLLPSAICVIKTVKSVFSSCRLFRETPQVTPLGAEDFTNIVMFCTTSRETFAFRDPVEADFLGSPARRKHLFPRNEVNEVAQGKGEIIRRGHTAGLEASQMKSAIGHWHVMRRVLPAKVWENW